MIRNTAEQPPVILSREQRAVKAIIARESQIIDRFRAYELVSHFPQFPIDQIAEMVSPELYDRDPQTAISALKQSLRGGKKPLIKTRAEWLYYGERRRDEEDFSSLRQRVIRSGVTSVETTTRERWRRLYLPETAPLSRGESDKLELMLNDTRFRYSGGFMAGRVNYAAVARSLNQPRAEEGIPVRRMSGVLRVVRAPRYRDLID